MDTQILSFILFGLQALGAAFCTVIWFAYRDLKAKQDRQQSELADHKLYAAEHYVTDTAFSKAIDSLARAVESMSTATAAKLERIENKLDGKQDKG